MCSNTWFDLSETWLRTSGKFNRRRNTSVALRLNGKNGGKAAAVIDVGKNFADAALEWFPEYSLRKNDAVLITHSHADAMNGLDDLRAWTFNRAIQSSIDIYLSKDTFAAVLRSFPYLVSKQHASGGSDAKLKWHIITAGVSFKIGETGILVTPFEVQHGRLFSNPTSCCAASAQSHSTSLKKTLNAIEQPVTSTDTIHPYMCMAFNISNKIVYMSDVSFIPDSAWKVFEQISTDRGGPLPVLVLDCLGLEPHTSHFCLAQSIEAARRVAPVRTYLTGIDHGVSHEQYVDLAERVKVSGRSKLSQLQANRRHAGHVVDEEEPIWMHPAHDGLQLFFTSGQVWDSTYDLGQDECRRPRELKTLGLLFGSNQIISQIQFFITALTKLLVLLILGLV